MKKKRRTLESILTPEEWEHYQRTEKLLLSRIEYHRAKLIEERPGWDAPKTDAEWRAYNEARIRERSAG